MASHIPYVIRRGAGLAFRRRVPVPARTFYAKSFFAFSLRTHVVSEARRRAAMAARFTDDLIGLAEACGADMLEDRQIDTVIDALMRAEIETVEALREQDGPRSAEAATAAIRAHEAIRETLRAALVYNDYQAVHAPLEHTFARLGIAPPEADGDWRRIGRRAARALMEVAGENIRREQGIYVCDARLSARPDAMDEAGPMRQAVTLPAPPAGQLPAQVKSTLPARPTSAPERETPAPERLKAVAAPDPAGDEPAKCRRVAPHDRAGAVRPAPHAKVVRRAGTAEDPFAVDVAELDPDSPFSDWFAAAICAKREQLPGWDRANLNNWRGTKKLLIEAFGDRPIGYYTPPG